MNTDTLTPDTNTFTPEPQLGQHVQDVKRSLNNVAQDVKTHAAARFEDAKQQAGETLEQAKVTATDVVASVRGFVAEHPFTSFGVGVLVGLYLRGRNR